MVSFNLLIFRDVTMSVELYTECLPELPPYELVMYSRLGMLTFADAPQIFRDRFMHSLIRTADSQAQAAIELGDEDGFERYCRALSLILRIEEQTGRGNNDFLHIRSR
jgi:hypothetical protein